MTTPAPRLSCCWSDTDNWMRGSCRRSVATAGPKPSSRWGTHLIPFNVTIPPDERDPHLADKLKAEWGGILQWAVEGCLAWRRDGLNPPAAVREATDQYLVAEDSFGAWLEEDTERDTADWAFESSAALFTAWKIWADRAGENPGTRKLFANTLQARGYALKRTEKARGFAGIRLRRRDYTDDPRTGQ